MATILPSTKQMALIYVIPPIVNNEKVQELPEELFDVLGLSLDKAKELLFELQQYLNHVWGRRPIFYHKSFHLLGKIYEAKGDIVSAIENYEKLLDLWKDADEDLVDLVDAKKRLKRLKNN